MSHKVTWVDVSLSILLILLLAQPNEDSEIFRHIDHITGAIAFFVIDRITKHLLARFMLIMGVYSVFHGVANPYSTDIGEIVMAFLSVDYIYELYKKRNKTKN